MDNFKKKVPVEATIGGGSSSGNTSGGSSSGSGAVSSGSSNNPSSSSGIGGFLNNIFTGLFSGNGFMNKVGKFLNFVMGPGTTSSLSNFLNNFKSLLGNGVTSNGNWSLSLFLFNTIWNTLAKYVLKKVAHFLNTMANKIKTTIQNILNKIPTTIPLIGNMLSSLKAKAIAASTKLINSLKLKAYTFVKSLLNKAKIWIKKKLGI